MAKVLVTATADSCRKAEKAPLLNAQCYLLSTTLLTNSHQLVNVVEHLAAEEPDVSIISMEQKICF